MPELLDPKSGSVNGFGRWKRRRTGDIAAASQRILAPKQLFVEIRSMAAGDCLAANLSRAVVQAIRQYGSLRVESESDELGLSRDDWLAGVGLREKDTENRQQQRSGVSNHISRRLMSLLHDAANDESRRDIIESFDAWISAQEVCGSTATAESFLDCARRLDQHGQTDAALDIIFDQIDEMLLAGEFEPVDQLLMEIMPSDYSVELLLGLLTVTLPAKNRLCNRVAFFERVRQSLQEHGETDEGLLVGLD